MFPRSRGGQIVWAWAPAIAMMAAIFGASGISDLPALPGDMSDHSGHFVGYALLGGLVLRALAMASWDRVSTTSGVSAWVIAVAYGASDEFHQSFVPGRTPAVDDVIADALGAGVAVAVLTVAAVGLRLHRRGV